MRFLTLFEMAEGLPPVLQPRSTVAFSLLRVILCMSNNNSIFVFSALAALKQATFQVKACF